MASRAMALAQPRMLPVPRPVFERVSEDDGILSRITQTENVRPEKIDLGLRAGVHIDFIPDRQNRQPYALLKIADQIKMFQTFPAGWDSYNANKLDDSAVLPAVELAILGIQRCRAPEIVLLPDGGLGLRWSSNERELEIDAHPGGEFSAFLENLQTGEEDEIEATNEMLSVASLLHRYLAD